MAQIESYTTTRGTKISQRILRDLMDSISKGEDCQRSITDHLRDVIPVHDDDLDEAMEVYNHAESVMDENDPRLVMLGWALTSVRMRLRKGRTLK